MSRATANVAVLGSTGSIGCSALAVIDSLPDSLQAGALSAHAKLDQLVDQAVAVGPRWVVASDPVAAAAQDWSRLPKDVKLLVGSAGLEEIASHPDIDIVVAAIVGSAGLRGTWAAVEAGKTVALANKETMVVAGPLVTELAAKTQARIVPVDSEHSAVFQACSRAAAKRSSASCSPPAGGRFASHTREQLAR